MIEAYFIHLAILVGIYLILALSLQLALGYTGLINLGHIAFFAIGGFLYIAGSDLIPELHKDFSVKKSIWQLIFFLIGIGLMALFTLLE